MKKENAVVTQVNDYTTKYDFSSVRLLKRIRMAIAIIVEGGFYFTGKDKTKTVIETNL